MSIETIDADLCKPAVLAVVFNTHARLEIKSVGKRAGTDRGKQFPGHDVHERWTFPTLDLTL